MPETNEHIPESGNNGQDSNTTIDNNRENVGENGNPNTPENGSNHGNIENNTISSGGNQANNNPVDGKNSNPSENKDNKPNDTNNPLGGNSHHWNNGFNNHPSSGNGSGNGNDIPGTNTNGNENWYGGETYNNPEGFEANPNNGNNEVPKINNPFTIQNNQTYQDGTNNVTPDEKNGSKHKYLPILGITALVLVLFVGIFYFIIKRRRRRSNKKFELNSITGEKLDDFSIIYGTCEVEKKSDEDQSNPDNTFTNTNITEMNYYPSIAATGHSTTFHDYTNSCVESNYSVNANVGLPYPYRNSFVSSDPPNLPNPLNPTNPSNPSNQPQQFNLPYSTPAIDTIQNDTPSHAPVIDLDVSSSSPPKVDTTINK